VYVKHTDALERIKADIAVDSYVGVLESSMKE
jgi:hypothetical protein